MDYKKKYNEMVRRAKELYESGNALTRQQMEIVCPELTESEDEKIRKAIESIIRVYGKTQGEWIAGYDMDTLVVHLRNAFASLVKQEEQKSVEKQDYSGLTDFERAIHRGFLCAGVENVPVEIIKETAQDCLSHIEHKPAEWSDSFEENIRNLLHDKLTWHSEDGSMASTVFIDDKTLKDIINGIWFYVGKEALKYPNKELNVPEWSEEEKRKFNRIYSVLRQAADTHAFSTTCRLISDKEAVELQDFLRSIAKPKQEWSEEDERKYQCIRNILLTDMDKKVGLWKYSEILEWYEKRGIGRYTYSKPSWKPSEEQMEALKFSLGNGGKYNKEALTNLYDSLKKLI